MMHKKNKCAMELYGWAHDDVLETSASNHMPWEKFVIKWRTKLTVYGN